MKFTGHERDESIGLDYMRARFNSPTQGRFLSRDPVLQAKRALKSPEQWNRYAYVMANPLKYVDPNGEEASIQINFTDSTLTEEQKKKIIAQVQAWYGQRDIGMVYVFDAAKQSHGGTALSRAFSSARRGYATIAVSGGSSMSHNPTTVFTGGLKDLKPDQFIRAVSNGIIHETAAHQFRVTYGHFMDAANYVRDGKGAEDPLIRARYGTVADSRAFVESTRSNVTDGPIPIVGGDEATMQQVLGPLDVEPPEDE
jgi:RHS repeat-associated protein